MATAYDLPDVEPIEKLREMLRSVSVQLQSASSRELQVLLPIHLKTAMSTEGNFLTKGWSNLEVRNMKSTLEKELSEIDLTQFNGFPMKRGEEQAEYKSLRILRFGVGIIDEFSRKSRDAINTSDEPRPLWNIDISTDYESDWSVQKSLASGVPGILDIHSPTWIHNTSMYNIDPRRKFYIRVRPENRSSTAVVEPHKEILDVILYLHIAYARKGL